ncbi:MAG: alpha amylase C-terminal domain-containing protein [Paludibacteraceae bacterium]|nr:alpha amylase C-terminal domain-containing protein [Paludibacteraceae bacterium]
MKSVTSPHRTRKKRLAIVRRDPYLQPYASVLEARCAYAERKEKELTGGAELKDWANGYIYFGLHRDKDGWVLREWAPNATDIWLIGETNCWEKRDEWRLRPTGKGIWEGHWPANWLQEGQLYKLCIRWNGGEGERIPAYAQRVVQNHSRQANAFYAQVDLTTDAATPKRWKGLKKGEALFIYECHIGMSGEEERIATYDEFRRRVLPRVDALGYNCLQLMAIQEHPYYGSFGYQVTNFFAASSRFGTPDELRALIEDAHRRGIAVILDLVHSHSAKNEEEGPGRQDGTPYQYFHAGERRTHPAWDSLCFDYGKTEVLHFLLSNCKYWMETYGFDGFRFDGVTSMLYKDHGLGRRFDSYDTYFDGNTDVDALCYLTLANRLIHQLNPRAVTIAEDMSGMPGIALKQEEGGIGFDYRLSLGIPDFWIRYIKEVRDEDWHGGHIYYELTNRRGDERTISYAESHDQALVGDKTIIFRLADKDMYWHFEHGHSTYVVDRAIALHKMIRLVTAITMQGGYLNFMGNEFGHPEWIDFPREGNGWSYRYARRQWSLVDNGNYYYADLNRFDKEMIATLKPVCMSDRGKNLLNRYAPELIWDKQADGVIAIRRGKLVAVFNWNGQKSYTDYGIPVAAGKYVTRLNTDHPSFGGFGLTDDTTAHFTQPDPSYESDLKGQLKLYLPARSAVVLEQCDYESNN